MKIMDLPAHNTIETGTSAYALFFFTTQSVILTDLDSNYM